MKIISTQELKKKIDSGDDFILVDVLSNKSYEARHIPKAINIPGNELEDKAQKELTDKNKEIVVYCSSSTCQASVGAGNKLEEMGYKNVAHYKDGLAGWQDAGYEFE